MFSEILSAYGTQILGTLLVALAGIFAMALKNVASRYLDTDTKRVLAGQVVRFAEQTYRELHGQQKLNAALEVFATLLKDKGIRASETEMKVLLEAAVAEFNDVFHKNAA